MDVAGKVDDVVAIARLRLALETRRPAELMAACQAGDAEALDVVCSALPAIRRAAGLSLPEMLGADLGDAFGLAKATRQ